MDLGAYRVVVKGGGDLGTGVACRLYRAGFAVVVLERAHPLAIRRRVAFAQAVYEGAITVEGVTARLVSGPEEALALLPRREVPVLVDEEGTSLPRLRPSVLVDATLCKRDPATRIGDAPFVVALGPGFRVGVHAHAVVETQRGHYLGRVYWEGQALPDTGEPGEIAGQARLRVLRAPVAGRFQAHRQIGDRVRAGEVVAEVAGHPIRAPFDGVLRGILADGLTVPRGMKVGDVDPRGVVAHCFTISDKALAVGGGVLEAVCAYLSGHAGGRGGG
ncbi:MAG: EF2563 family selenium-dependent molybdenum hydroxylase system protein [Anaerolineae bacterium]|nr:EF2563 family selenium-dependent molybdenum hydroxylase system protein [Anaerolineae bacterium]